MTSFKDPAEQARNAQRLDAQRHLNLQRDVGSITQAQDAPRSRQLAADPPGSSRPKHRFGERMTDPTDRAQKERAQYQLMHASEDDLGQAAFYASHLLKKGWHSEEWQHRGTVYLQQAAFTTALVMAYARPFTPTKSGAMLPAKVRAGYNDAQKTLHLRIMNLRNEIFAHTDVPKRGIRPLSIDGYPTAIEFRPTMRLTKEEVQHLQIMIQQVRGAVAERKTQLLPRVSTGEYGMPRSPRLPRGRVELERRKAYRLSEDT